ITKEGKMVMERQYRHGAGITSYELPCGVVEAGEDPLDAARRELEEETGYTGGEWIKLMVTSANPGSMNNWAHSYLAVGVEKTTNQHLDSTEELEVHLLDQDYVKALLLDNQILQALMVGPLYKYFYEIKG
ncbi:MAG: NUDIX hydrolase, partial [Bacteroidaceae bacterium]